MSTIAVSLIDVLNDSIQHESGVTEYSFLYEHQMLVSLVSRCSQ